MMCKLGPSEFHRVEPHTVAGEWLVHAELIGSEPAVDFKDAAPACSWVVQLFAAEQAHG